MKDRYYDYSSFSDKKIESIFKTWDNHGLKDYHGRQITFHTSLLSGDSVLDVGCGTGHLYEAIKNKIKSYVGIDNNERVVKLAKEKHPNLRIELADANDLSKFGMFDMVYGIGLFSTPRTNYVIREMLSHAKMKVVFDFRVDDEEVVNIENLLGGLEFKRRNIYNELHHNLDRLVVVELIK